MCGNEKDGTAVSAEQAKNTKQAWSMRRSISQSRKVDMTKAERAETGRPCLRETREKGVERAIILRSFASSMNLVEIQISASDGVRFRPG